MTTTPVDFTPRTTSLDVSEIFGPTVQGEGPSAGHRCAFIRLGMCNLDCAWCDTPYTWDWAGKNGTAFNRGEELHRMGLDAILRELTTMSIDRVVITGGEPIIQRRQLAPMLEVLSDLWTVEVETNGTLDPGHAMLQSVDRWNVSPKLAHSGVPRLKAWKPDVLNRLARTGKAAFKFVCMTEADLDEIDYLISLTEIPACEVWVMPEGRDAPAMVEGLQRLADPAIAHGFNLTTRLHVFAWGDTRGT